MAQRSVLFILFAVVVPTAGCAAEGIGSGEPMTVETSANGLCWLRGQPTGEGRCGDTEDFRTNEGAVEDPSHFVCGEAHSCDFRSGWFGSNEEWCGQRGHAFTLSSYTRASVPRPTIAMADYPQWQQDLLLWDGGDIVCKPAVNWPAAVEKGVARYDYDCFSSGVIGDWFGDLAYDASVGVLVGVGSAFVFTAGTTIVAFLALSGGIGATVSALAWIPAGAAAGAVTGIGAGVASAASRATDPSAFDCSLLYQDPRALQAASLQPPR